jgi:hypothetical protein
MKTYTQEDINEQYEDEIEPVNCPHCLERGYKIRLGGRILEPNDQDQQTMRTGCNVLLAYGSVQYLNCQKKKQLLIK